ncbi:MAG: toll/interleukin-1 receptor domain-containing protein [Blastocatellia bacterium]
MKRQVFVSHAGPDTWVARQIARGIKGCGASPFLDEAEIQAGQDFEEEILTFLNKAHELVVLLTPWALDRPYVWAELGAAWARKIPIVALLHGISATDLQTRSGAPVFLKSKNCRTLNDADSYFAELRRQTKRPLHSKKGAP